MADAVIVSVIMKRTYFSILQVQSNQDIKKSVKKKKDEYDEQDGKTKHLYLKSNDATENKRLMKAKK